MRTRKRYLDPRLVFGRYYFKKRQKEAQEREDTALVLAYDIFLTWFHDPTMRRKKARYVHETISDASKHYRGDELKKRIEQLVILLNTSR